MKTFTKTIKIIIAIVALTCAVAALCVIDTNLDLTTLVALSTLMLLGFYVGITLLINTFPDYFNEDELSEEEKEVIEEYLEENMTLIQDKKECLLIIQDLVAFINKERRQVPYGLAKRIENQMVDLKDMD